MFLRQRFTTGPNILSYSLNATGKLESYIESTAAATLNGDCCDFFLIAPLCGICACLNEVSAREEMPRVLTVEFVDKFPSALQPKYV